MCSELMGPRKHMGSAVAITVVVARKCPGHSIPSAACQRDGKALESSSARWFPEDCKVTQCILFNAFH